MPVALITGGASFMSRHTARRLLAQDWKIALADINRAGMEEVAKELGLPDRVARYDLDVTQLETVKVVVADITRRWGPITALVNVAGGNRSLKQPRKEFITMSPAEWDIILNANLKGVLNCCHAVLPGMIEAKKGCIVSVSAGRGLRGGAKASIYSTAKAGVIVFSQALAQEVGKYGIRVNTVIPGNAASRWKTDDKEEPASGRRSPLGKRTTPEDVGNGIVFLLSEDASHITGSCLDISGGTSLH